MARKRHRRQLDSARRRARTRDREQAARVRAERRHHHIDRVADAAEPGQTRQLDVYRQLGTPDRIDVIGEQPDGSCDAIDAVYGAVVFRFEFWTKQLAELRREP